MKENRTGAAPISVSTAGAGMSHARGPDDAPLLTREVRDGDTVFLPDGSGRGDSLFTFFDAEGPAGFVVPQVNPTRPLVRAIDTSADLRDLQAGPSGDTVSWSVDASPPPYWVGVFLAARDGRSTTSPGSQVTVTTDSAQGRQRYLAVRLYGR